MGMRTGGRGRYRRGKTDISRRKLKVACWSGSGRKLGRDEELGRRRLRAILTKLWPKCRCSTSGTAKQLMPLFLPPEPPVILEQRCDGAKASRETQRSRLRTESRTESVRLVRNSACSAFGKCLIGKQLRFSWATDKDEVCSSSLRAPTHKALRDR
jgi:hypothetical protein